MEQKIYIGKGKIGKYGPRIRIDLNKIPAEHTKDGWVSLNIGELRQPDDRGNTLTVTVDTWKPDPSRKQQTATHDDYNQQPQHDDDMPF